MELFEVTKEVLEKLRKAGNMAKRYILMGFSGWPDAGNVASLTIQHFIESLTPEKLLEFASEDLQDMMISRPTVEIDDGLIKGLYFTEGAFYLWSSANENASLLILKSPEPGFRWREFSEKILDLCEVMSVQRIYLVGGLLDMVPHTRRPKISAAVNMDHLRAEIMAYGITPSNYRGPAGIHSLILLKARERGLEAVSIWGHASSYMPYPNAIVAFHLASSLAEMMKIPIEFERLAELANTLKRRLDTAMEENPELRSIVRELERKYDEESGAPSYIS